MYVHGSLMSEYKKIEKPSKGRLYETTEGIFHMGFTHRMRWRESIPRYGRGTGKPGTEAAKVAE